VGDPARPQVHVLSTRHTQATAARATLVALAALALAACTAQPVAPAKPEPQLGALWVRHAAEYEALGMQAYAAAAEDLDRLLRDESWTALPGQVVSSVLRPAIIFDIDETVLNNSQFQLEHEPPFSDDKFDDWHAANQSPAVPGAPEFVQRARAAGVEVFFVTNRRCAPRGNDPEPCPQERITLGDLRDAGMEADPDHVLLSGEKPEWTQEKQVRRDALAADYRVIMLFGDDLGDFLPCVRKRVVAPCNEPATPESRRAATGKHRAFWGNGWYVLPNPMYGSWTSVQ
jgi:5'-nucleotidase (lipoprotein e(P4) family)